MAKVGIESDKKSVKPARHDERFSEKNTTYKV